MVLFGMVQLLAYIYVIPVPSSHVTPSSYIAPLAQVPSV